MKRREKRRKSKGETEGSGKISVSVAVLEKQYHRNLSHLTRAVAFIGKRATIA